jgi:integrase/recombinase XerC
MSTSDIADKSQILQLADDAASVSEARRHKGHRKPPTYLKVHERDQLLAIVTDPRDKAIITLFCYAGLRLNELVMLNRSDIDFTERTVLIRFAKGGKWRKVGLHRLPDQAIRDYLATRIDDDPALFLSQRRTRINWRSVEAMLDRYTSQLDLGKRVTPHCLRHTFATALLRQCKDLQIVQRAMGHSNIQTTTIYLHLEDDALYGAMDQL